MKHSKFRKFKQIISLCLTVVLTVTFGAKPSLYPDRQNKLSPRSGLNLPGSFNLEIGKIPYEQAAERIDRFFEELKAKNQSESEPSSETELNFSQLLCLAIPEKAGLIKKLKDPAKSRKLVPNFVPNESYLTLQTSELIQAMAELVANGQDTHIEAFLGEKSRTIGRFGVGALQIFGELLEKDAQGEWMSDSVQRAIVLESKRRGTGDVVYFLFYLHQGEVVFNSLVKAVAEDYPNGTKVTILRNLNKDQIEERKEFLQKGYQLNTRTPIEIQIESKPKQLLYKGSEYQFFGEGEKPSLESGVPPVLVKLSQAGFSVQDQGMGMDEKIIYEHFLDPKSGSKQTETKKVAETVSAPLIYFKKSSGEKRKLGLWLNGRLIAEKPVKKSAFGLDEVHFVFPHNANTTENWLSLELDNVSVASIKKLIDLLVNPHNKVSDRFLLIQSVVDLIQVLQPNREFGSEGDLLEYFSQKLQPVMPALAKGRLVYPNDPAWKEVRLPEKALFVSTELIPQQESVFQGMNELSEEEVARFKAGAMRIFVTPFSEHTENSLIYGVDDYGKWIILNKDFWDLKATHFQLIQNRIRLIEWPEKIEIKKIRQKVFVPPKKSNTTRWGMVTAALLLILTIGYFYQSGLARAISEEIRVATNSKTDSDIQNDSSNEPLPNQAIGSTSKTEASETEPENVNPPNTGERDPPQPERVAPPAPQPERVAPPAPQPERVDLPAPQPERVNPPAPQPERVAPPAPQPIHSVFLPENEVPIPETTRRGVSNLDRVLFPRQSRGFVSLFGNGQPARSQWNGQSDFRSVLGSNSRTPPAPLISVTGDVLLIDGRAFIKDSYDLQMSTGFGDRSSSLGKIFNPANRIGTIQLSMNQVMTVRNGQVLNLLIPWNGALTEVRLFQNNRLIQTINNISDFEGRVTFNGAAENVRLEWSVDLYSQISWKTENSLLPTREEASFEQVYNQLFIREINKPLEELQRSSEQERLNAIIRILSRYFAYDLQSNYKFTGGSWFNTFVNLYNHSSDERAHVVCNGTARYFFIMARALGLEAVYHEVELIQGTQFYGNQPSHAYASVKVDGRWRWIETTAIVPYIEAETRTGPPSVNSSESENNTEQPSAGNKSELVLPDLGLETPDSFKSNPPPAWFIRTMRWTSQTLDWGVYAIPLILFYFLQTLLLSVINKSDNEQRKRGLIRNVHKNGIFGWLLFVIIAGFAFYEIETLLYAKGSGFMVLNFPSFAINFLIGLNATVFIYLVSVFIGKTVVKVVDSVFELIAKIADFLKQDIPDFIHEEQVFVLNKAKYITSGKIPVMKWFNFTRLGKWAYLNGTPLYPVDWGYAVDRIHSFQYYHFILEAHNNLIDRLLLGEQHKKFSLITPAGRITDIMSRSLDKATDLKEISFIKNENRLFINGKFKKGSSNWEKFILYFDPEQNTLIRIRNQDVVTAQSRIIINHGNNSLHLISKSKDGLIVSYIDSEGSISHSPWPLETYLRPHISTNLKLFFVVKENETDVYVFKRNGETEKVKTFYEAYDIIDHGTILLLRREGLEKYQIYNNNGNVVLVDKANDSAEIIHNEVSFVQGMLSFNRDSDLFNMGKAYFIFTQIHLNIVKNGNLIETVKVPVLGLKYINTIDNLSYFEQYQENDVYRLNTKGEFTRLAENPELVREMESDSKKIFLSSKWGSILLILGNEFADVSGLFCKKGEHLIGSNIHRDAYGNSLITVFVQKDETHDCESRFYWNGIPYSFQDEYVDKRTNREKYRQFAPLLSKYISLYNKKVIDLQLKRIRDWSPYHLSTIYFVHPKSLPLEIVDEFEAYVESLMNIDKDRAFKVFLFTTRLFILLNKDHLQIFNRWRALPRDLQDEILESSASEPLVSALAEPEKLEQLSEEAQIYAYILMGKKEYVLLKEDEFKDSPELQDIFTSKPETNLFIPNGTSLAQLTRGISSRQRKIDQEQIRIRKTVTNQDRKGRLFIRELVQNARDASLLEKYLFQTDETSDITPAVQIRSYLNETDKGLEWIFSVADSVGIVGNDLIEYLLSPDTSTKSKLKGALSADGFLGQGFFTVFNDSSEVRIRTGKRGEVIDARLKPLFDAEGVLKDIQIVSIAVYKGQFKGTLIQKVHRITDQGGVNAKGEFSMTRSQAILEHAYIWSLLRKYVALVRDVNLTWNNKPFNEPVTVLEEEEGIELLQGELKIGRVTLNSLFVQTIAPVYLAHPQIPDWLREHFNKLKLNLNFPKGTQPIRSRTALKNPRQYQEKIKNLLFKWILKEYREGNFQIPGLPPYNAVFQKEYVLKADLMTSELAPLIFFKENPETVSLWDEFKPLIQNRETESPERDRYDLLYSQNRVLTQLAYAMKQIYIQILGTDLNAKQLLIFMDAQDLERKVNQLKTFVLNGEIPYAWLEELVEALASGPEQKKTLLDKIIVSKPFWNRLQKDLKMRFDANSDAVYHEAIQFIKDQAPKRGFVHFQLQDRLPDQYPPLETLLTGNQGFRILRQTLNGKTAWEMERTRLWYRRHLSARYPDSGRKNRLRFPRLQGIDLSL